MDNRVGDDPQAASCAPPIEVVHAFGSCPDKVRDNICALDDEHVVYVVGSRVAIATVDSHASSSNSSSSRRLIFLSTGLRVARVTCVSCSPDKRFVVVCYKAVREDGPHQAAAYATVYHMPTRPRASRVKTISYERPSHYQQQRDHAFSDSRSRGSTRRCGSGATGSSAGGSYRGGSKRQARPPPPTPLASSTAEFVTASFSDDGRILAVLDGSPEWTLLWFEWKTGKRLFTLQMESMVHRCADGIAFRGAGVLRIRVTADLLVLLCLYQLASSVLDVFSDCLVACRVVLSPIDFTKTATAGADGLFKIWRTPQGGKVSPMAPIAGLREVGWSCSGGISRRVGKLCLNLPKGYV